MTKSMRLSICVYVCLAFVLPLWSQQPSPKVLKALGVVHPEGMTATEASLSVARRVEAMAQNMSVPIPASVPTFPGSIGFPLNMDVKAALSAAIVVSRGGPLNDVVTFGDWDGAEDLVADHGGKVDDFLGKVPSQGFTLTRTAISEHTIANGFSEDIFYYGDSFGNVYVSATSNLQQSTPAPKVMVINVPTALNAFGTLNGNDQIVITGLCVNPVADLTSFANVNGSYASFAGKVGEILYVTFWDTAGGLRTTGGATVHSGLLAFPIADVTSPAPTPPGVISPMGFPVTVGGAFGVTFSPFANVAGCACDDDGDVFFQQVDLVGFTGANIVKARPAGTNNDRSLATSGFGILTTLNPANGSYGTSSGPASQVNRYTNYSGTSTTFGNIVALAAGPGDALYAAVSRSLVATDSPATQDTEGLFTNPVALGSTPSMIISFSDYQLPPPSGTFPVYTGFASPVAPGTVIPGVNNFRAFVLGTGPDRRSSTSLVFGSTSNTLQMAMQIDYTIYSGLAVDEARTVYVISGGTPANVGLNPSPSLGEVMIFPDSAPADRRADYIDLRTDGTLPNPPSAGPNKGDGKSDRYDHIFVQAPLDPVAFTPVGLSGLGRGFLRYLNRTAPNSVSNLPNGTTQAFNSSNGPIAFNDFDPSHQVAGGDLVFASGGTQFIDYEYLFGADISGVCTMPWTSFYLNSDGNITFGQGDTNSPTVTTFLVGTPRIAGAWIPVDTSNRTSASLIRFPVQALGFAGVNTFKVRWIGVPAQFSETSTFANNNTFSMYLFDDGIGTYRTNPVALKGPTAFHFIKQSNGTLVGFPPRPLGSAKFDLEYGRIDVTSGHPVISGYSVGDQSPVATQTNLSTAGAGTAYCPQCITLGNGTQKEVFEFFNTDFFDLRFQGSSAQLSKPSKQVDLNREFVDFASKSCP